VEPLSFFEELKRRNVFRVGIAYLVVAWLVMQVADVVINNIGAPDWLFPGIMLVIGIGFPLVLVFAWAYEMTPEGLKREKDVDRSQSITTLTGRKLDRTIIIILVLAVSYLLFDKMILQDKEKGPGLVSPATTAQVEDSVEGKGKLTPEDGFDDSPSVAVLPFINMSGDTDNEYFSDGLTETLLHMLAQLPELRVAARTSSFSFKGKDAGIEEIARALKVAHILEGSVQKAGNRVRVTAQLIRADDGFHVWSQNYDRTLNDIFAIQDEIAEDVASVLDATLLNPGERMPHVKTADLGAYDTYLRALEQQAIGSYASLTTAETLFKQALGVDPEFIDAMLGLARNFYMQFNTGMVTELKMQQAIAPLLQQVRDIQPENKLARVLEMAIQLHPDIMIDQATLREKLDPILALLPLLPAETYIRGQMALAVGFGLKEYETGLRILQDGLMVDPLSPELYAAQGNIYRGMQRYEDARGSFLKAIELDPRDPNNYSRMSVVSEELGDIIGVFKWRRENVEADPQDHEVASHMARAFYEWGLPEEGDVWMKRVEVLAPNSDMMQRLKIDQAYAQGDIVRLIATAEKMIAAVATMRHGVFPTALYSYTNEMCLAGRQKEAYDFLTGLRPELKDYEFLPEDVQGVLMQGVTIELMSAFASSEEIRAAWLTHSEKLHENGPWWFEDPNAQAIDAFFRGDLETAIEKALEDLAQPLASFPLRPDAWKNPTWAPITADPRVVARLSELEQEKQEIRSQIIEMLQGPEWTK
jgi:TolB-like protein/cytochrome c-type biogenesis protein CcmH/NrfG